MNRTYIGLFWLLLEQLLVYRCQKLMKEHQLIRGLTCYHWWPKTREVVYN